MDQQIVRIAQLEIDPEQLLAYLGFLKERSRPPSAMSRA